MYKERRLVRLFREMSAREQDWILAIAQRWAGEDASRNGIGQADDSMSAASDESDDTASAASNILIFPRASADL